MACLVAAMALVRFVPLRRWRHLLPRSRSCRSGDPESEAALARRLSAHVDRAAWRLQTNPKCLPRAVALSRMLARRGIGHVLVIAVRPMSYSGSGQRLHAWIEHRGVIVIGELPGPWNEIFRTSEKV